MVHTVSFTVLTWKHNVSVSYCIWKHVRRKCLQHFHSVCVCLHILLQPNTIMWLKLAWCTVETGEVISLVPVISWPRMRQEAWEENLSCCGIAAILMCVGVNRVGTLLTWTLSAWKFAIHSHIDTAYTETPLRYCLCSTWYSSFKATQWRHPWFIQWLKGTRSVLLSGVQPFPFCENIFPLEPTKPFFIAWKQPSILLCYRLSRHTHSGPFSETAKCTKAWRSSCVPHHSALLFLDCILDPHLS